MLLIILIPLYYTFQNLTAYIIILSIFITIISVFSLLIYAYYELEYIISNESLLIKWGLKTTRISINEIKRVIKLETNHYEGIRLGGAAIPGYFIGKFKFLIEGNFESASLYATKLENLIFIETNGRKRKYYGITPHEVDGFIRALDERSSTIEPQVIEKRIPFKATKTSSKDIKIALSLFIISIIFLISGLIYFIIIYVQLPPVIPLHFSYNFIPNRYGNKMELIGVMILLLIFGIGFSSLFYYYIHRRTHLDQTKYGYSIMLLPLAISLLYLILTIIILNQTLAIV